MRGLGARCQPTHPRRCPHHRRRGRRHRHHRQRGLTTPGRQRSARDRVALAALLAGSVGGWDASALFFIYPDIRDGLAGGNETDASWVLSITSIVAAALLLQAGRIADRFGHQRVFQGGAVLYAASGIVAAASPSVWWLVAARAFMAGGLAVTGPAAVALILRATPPSEHATAIGRWGVYTAAAGVLGPGVATVLIDTMSWRVAFALQVPMGLTLWWLAREPAGLDEPDTTTSVRPLDVGLTMVALVLLIWPILEGNDWGWTSARTITCASGSILALGALVIRSSDAATAPIPMDLLRHRDFVLILLLSITAGVMFFGQWLAYLLFLTEVWGYSLVESALVLTIMPAAMTTMAVRAGRWVDQYGPRVVMIPGAALYALSSGVFRLMADTEPNLTLLIIVLFPAGLALATIWPTLTSAGNRGVDRHRLGTSSALIQTVQRVGGALGIAVVVALVAGGGDDLTRHLRGIAVMPVAALTTVALAALLTRPTPVR